MSLELLPGEEVDENDFLSGEEIDESQLTPTGLPQLTPEQAPLRAQMAPAAGQVAGFDIPIPTPIAESLTGFAKTMTQPEVAIPTAAGIAGGIMGNAPGSMVASGIAGALVDLQKQVSDVFDPNSPISENEFVLRKTMEGLPFGQQLYAIDAMARAQTLDPFEVTKSAFASGLIEAGIDGGSYAVAKLIGMVPTMGPKPERAFTELADEMAKHGVRPTLAQATDSTVIDWLDGVARSGPISSGIINGLDESNIQALEVWIRDINKNFIKTLKGVTSDSDIGKLLDKNVNLGRSAYKAASDIMYDKVDDMAGGTVQKVMKDRATVSEVLNPKTGKPFIIPGKIAVDEVVGGVRVPTKGIKGIIQEELVRSSEIMDADIRGKVAATLRNAMKMNDTISFSGAHRLRSFMLDEIRDGGNPGAGRIYGKVMKSIDTSMEKAAEDLNPQALSAWRKANRFYRNGKKIFEDDFMERLFIEHKKASTQIGHAIYKNGNVDSIQTMKKALRAASRLSKEVNYEESLGAMRTGYQEGLLNKHLIVDQSLPGGKTYNFKGILSDLEDRDTRATMESLFSREHRTALLKWAKAGDIATAKAGSRPFSFVQGAAIAGAVMNPGVKSASAATIIVSLPTWIAKMMTSKKAIEHLTRGFTEIGKGTRAGIQAAEDLAIRAVLSYRSENRERVLNRFDSPIYGTPGLDETDEEE